MPKKLGLYLLSYKRPKYIQEAIESILLQDYDQFDLIISENTPDESVIQNLNRFATDPRVFIIKRDPSLASLDHFNTIISEARQTYEYCMLFHDDDRMLPGAISKLMSSLESNSNLAAISSNAYFIDNEKNSSKLFNPKLIKNTEIRTASELIRHYILKRLGHTPFPTYIYRTEFLNELSLDSKDGGKYSDVSFLTKLVRHAPIYWLSEPLFQYRIHGQNDSSKVNLTDIGKLCRFYLKQSPQSALMVIFYYGKQMFKKIILENIRHRK